MHYDKVLAIEPHTTDVLIEKADNLTQLEKYEEVISLYYKALEINSDDAYAYSMKKVMKLP